MTVPTLLKQVLPPPKQPNSGQRSSELMQELLVITNISLWKEREGGGGEVKEEGRGIGEGGERVRGEGGRERETER